MDLNGVVKNHSHIPRKKQLTNSKQSSSSAAEVQEKKGIFITQNSPALGELHHTGDRK